MKTIAFVATKGGTGKTSLAFVAGIEAAKHGSVYFADIDPQKSLTSLCERRGGKELFEENPTLLSDVGSLVSAVATLKRTGFERDYLIADTPGSLMPVIRDAILAADCIVLPVQQSPLDVLAQEDAAQYIRELGKGDVAFFVINRIDRNANPSDLVARIGPIFPNPPVLIKQRLIYAKALITGRTAAEADNKAAEEISALWQSINSILKKEANHGHENSVAGGHGQTVHA